MVLSPAEHLSWFKQDAIILSVANKRLSNGNALSMTTVGPVMSHGFVMHCNDMIMSHGFVMHCERLAVTIHHVIHAKQCAGSLFNQTDPIHTDV
jgi:hypothetical protein